MGIISQKLRNSARGRDCTLRTPFCNGDPETTVLCHAPSNVSGMGSKGHDYHAAFGCHDCHMAMDHRKVSRPEYYWMNGLMETWNTWILEGLIVVPVDPARAKRRPGSKANMPSRKIQNRPFPKQKVKL